MATDKATTLRMLAGVPLDKSYEHTIYWESKTAQEYGFFSKVKKSYNNLSYQRVGKGRIRIQENVGVLYDCNYMMFKNPGFGDKWFYAFVDDVEYINDVTTEVRYTIDPLQTWWGDWKLGTCYVEREHALTDVPGTNIQPENLDIGDYIHTRGRYEGIPADLLDWRIVVVNTAKGDKLNLEVADPAIYCGSYHQAEVYVVNPRDASQMAALKKTLDAFALFTNADAVVDMHMCPSLMVPKKYDSLTQEAWENKCFKYNEVPFSDKDGGGLKPTLGGYVPRNGKLYTYPYTRITVDNNQGCQVHYAYEYFKTPDGKTPRYALYCAGVVNPQMVLAPCYYKEPNGETQGKFGPDSANWSESISRTDFPKCSWATNDLGAKLIQTGISLATTAAGFAVGGVIGAAVGGVSAGAGAVSSKAEPPSRWNGEITGFTGRQQGKRVTPPTPAPEIPRLGEIAEYNLLKTMGDMSRAAITPNITSNIVPSDMLYAADRFNFLVTQEYIQEQFARRIDAFFDKYGYATRQLKVPRITGRPHWCYTKTIGCMLTGDLPAKDAEAIINIFDNGITFWNNIDEVGNYSLDNTVVGSPSKQAANTNEVTNNEQTE